MRRCLAVVAITAAMLVPTSVAALAVGEQAAFASSLSCRLSMGNLYGAVRVNTCSPSGGSNYKSAKAPTAVLTSGGTFKWNGGATTTIGNMFVPIPLAPPCFLYQGTVTAASTSGPGIPAVGDRFQALICPTSSGGTFTRAIMSW
jgi:hypothetical protein